MQEQLTGASTQSCLNVSDLEHVDIDRVARLLARGGAARRRVAQNIYIYIYIYVSLSLSLYIHIYIYIYIYVYTCRCRVKGQSMLRSVAKVRPSLRVSGARAHRDHYARMHTVRRETKHIPYNISMISYCSIPCYIVTS